ncbi:MAG: DUF4861 family protein [Candidatus Neomarinimicrobiota bacterium]
MWLKNKVERVSSIDSSICEIVINCALRSQIQTKYFGWKTEAGKFDLISELTIDAGSRLTKHTLKITDNPPNLCTGIVKMENTTVFTSQANDEGWMYLATYGKQSLAGDSLGLAILFQKNDLIQLTEDPNSHAVVLKPVNNSLTYYFLAAWDKEPNGIRSCSQFAQYLNETARQMDNPVIVKIE